MLENLKKSVTGGAIMAAVALGTLVASEAPASARVVCNRWGYCWHVRRPHPYYGAYYGSYYDPYYYGYYGYGDPYYYPYDYGPPYGYYGPGFYGPSIGFGFSFGGGRGFHHR